MFFLLRFDLPFSSSFLSPFSSRFSSPFLLPFLLLFSNKEKKRKKESRRPNPQFRCTVFFWPDEDSVFFSRQADTSGHKVRIRRDLGRGCDWSRMAKKALWLAKGKSLVDSRRAKFRAWLRIGVGENCGLPGPERALVQSGLPNLSFVCISIIYICGTIYYAPSSLLGTRWAVQEPIGASRGNCERVRHPLGTPGFYVPTQG